MRTRNFQRRSCFGVFLFPLLLSCTTGGVWLKPDPSPPSFTPHCVAIPPLQNLSLTSKAGIILGELLSYELEGKTSWEVLSPMDYLSLIASLKTPRNDPMDPAMLLFLRDRLGIDTLIYGTIQEYWYTDDPEVYRDKQPAIALTLEVIRTDTGEEIFHVVVTRSYTSLFGDTLPLTTLAQKIALETAEVLKNTFVLASSTTPSCRFRAEIAPPLATAELPSSTPSPPSTTQTTLASLPSPSTTPPPSEILTLARDLASGKTVILKGVKFKKGSLELLPESEPTLLQLAEVMKADPSLRVLLIVHTDNEGTPEELLQLSQRQAESLRSLLVERYGIPRERIEVEGRGGRENIVPNTNEFLKEVNRRVEAVLLSRSSAPHGETEGTAR